MNCAWPVAAGELACAGELTEVGQMTVFIASEILGDATAPGQLVKVYACDAHLEQAKALIGANGLNRLSIDGDGQPALYVPAFGEWPPDKEKPLDD